MYGHVIMPVGHVVCRFSARGGILQGMRSFVLACDFLIIGPSGVRKYLVDNIHCAWVVRVHRDPKGVSRIAFYCMNVGPRMGYSARSRKICSRRYRDKQNQECAPKAYPFSR